MTDEEYVFRSDIKEKSKTARSARNAYSSRRRGCHLSTDHITRKEWERMNGPIHSIKLDAPITWEEFKSKPEDLQKQYLDNVFAKYKIGPTALAKMFGISGQYCGTYLVKLGYTFEGKAKPSETERFLADYGQAPATAMPVTTTAMSLDRFSFVLSGAFSPEEVAARLTGLFPVGTDVEITIEVAVR